MRRRIILFTLLISTVISLNVLACGDSLYRVGKGMSYRVYTAPLPGSVLVYGQSEGARQLAEELAKSGHGVHLVENEEELTTELVKGGYDVVIAPYSEHETIESSTDQADSSKVSYIPVTMSEGEERLAKQSYSRVMAADKDEIKHYLKAIHKTLKSKT
ncbi:MAG: hypothetical protein OEU84_16695 [Xanthomonadales bacterium]|nr:hypothetical protein [Xanthomonadales bacterium]